MKTLVGSCLLAIWTLATAQSTDPTMTTSPSPPIAGEPFTVTASFIGAADGPFMFVSSAYNFINVGNFDVHTDFGSVTVDIPPQASGEYTISFGGFGFSPLPIYASFPLTVVASNASATVSLPVLSHLGLVGAVVLIGLFGLLGLRRRIAS